MGLQVFPVSGVFQPLRIVYRHDLVAAPERRRRFVHRAVDQERHAERQQVFVTFVLAHFDQLAQRQCQLDLPALAFHHHAAFAFGDNQRIDDLVHVVHRLAVDRNDPVAVLESELAARFVEGVSPARIFVREVVVAPRVADSDVDEDGQQNVHHHAGYHHQKTLPCGFGAEFIGLGGQFHLLLVHRLVDHAGDLAVSAQRQPAQPVFGVAALEFEERKPRVEEDIELVDADFEDPRHEEVSQFVNAHQNGEAEEKLNDLDDNIHVRVLVTRL